MDLTYMLFMQGDSDPGDDDEPITKREPEPPAPNPIKPVPATPDANPIDPRVGQPW